MTIGQDDIVMLQCWHRMQRIYLPNKLTEKGQPIITYYFIVDVSMANDQFCGDIYRSEFVRKMFAAEQINRLFNEINVQCFLQKSHGSNRWAAVVEIEYGLRGCHS